MAWKSWSGRDVACFVEKWCGLPQYSTAMAQISGGTLQVRIWVDLGWDSVGW